MKKYFKKFFSRFFVAVFVPIINYFKILFKQMFEDRILSFGTTAIFLILCLSLWRAMGTEAITWQMSRCVESINSWWKQVTYWY